MDATQEKKWFIYIGDHHEGPISIDEIQQKLSQGQVTSGSFVWAEGMPDWKAMNEIDAFQGLSQSASDSAPAPAPVAAPIQEDAPAPALATAEEIQMPNENKSAPVQVVGGQSKMKRAIRLLILLGGPAAIIGLYMAGMLNPLLENPAVKAMTISMTESVRPQLIALSEKVPLLKGIISPIPHLEDVNPDELEELKHAAGQPEGGAPVVALAMSQGDLLMPSFYAAGNVSEGAQYFLVVVGIGDTLLNQTSFDVSRKVTFSKKMAKSEPVRAPDGKSLPRGEYFVTIQDSLPEATPAAPAVQTPPQTPPPAQPGQPAAAVPPPEPPAQPVAKKINVLVKKQYFLGGPKDATYQQRLKEYHDRIKAKAVGELNEVKQFAATLESQITGTATAFAKMKGKSPKTLKLAQKKQWEAHHTKWEQLQKQLDQSFSAWTPDVLNREMFYSMLYSRLQNIATTLNKFHQLEHSYFTDPKVDVAQIEGMHGPMLNELQATLGELKAKIDQAEKIPPSPRGLPRKDGL